MSYKLYIVYLKNAQVQLIYVSLELFLLSKYIWDKFTASRTHNLFEIIIYHPTK